MEEVSFFRKVIKMALTDGLVSYWKLDELSGDAIDSVNGYNGTNVGVTQGILGKINNCYSLDTDYIQVNSENDLKFYKEGVYSWGFWINVRDTGPNGIYNCGKVGMLVEYGTTLDFIDTVTLNWTRWRFTNIFSINQWNYFVVTYDYPNRTISVFKNGIALSTTSNNYNWDSATDQTTTYFRFCQWYNFNGLIDEIGMWNRLLTIEEASELYNNGRGLTYPFNKNSTRIGGAVIESYYGN